MSEVDPRMVFVTGRFEQPMTGGEKYNFNMVHYLQENGADVHILTLDGVARSVSGTGLWNHLLCNFWWCRTMLTRNDHRTIFLVTSYVHSRVLLPTLILALLGRSRLVAICHHLAYHDLRSRFRMVVDRPVEAMFLRLMNRVITISESARQELIALGVAFDRVTVVTPGFNQRVELAEHKQRDETAKETFQVLSVGTCAPRKGLLYLLQAVRLLKERCNVRVHVVGDTEDDPVHYQSLVDSMTEEALQDKVCFYGRISEAELDNLYAKADMFVLSSLWEGYGIVLLEAMAHSLPIIATNVGAIPELVRHGENGWLVPPGDSQALAEAIFSLSQDRTLCTKLGRRGREFSEQSPTWDEVGEQLRQVLLKEVGF